MLLSDLIKQYDDFAKLKYKKPASLSISDNKGFTLDLRQFCLYMHNPHIENIRPKDVNNYLMGMMELGWQSMGVRPKSTAIKNLLKYALHFGLKVMSPELVAMPPKEFRIPHVASDEDIRKILDLCPRDGNTYQARNRAMITFLRSTGCRNSEMGAINLSQLMEHFTEKRVVIRTAKSRGMRPIRELFWDEETHQNLIAWLNARETLKSKTFFADPDALFVGVQSWQAGKRLTNSAVCIMLRELSKKAGIRTLNAHSLRHYRGHELNSLGANNTNISGVLGHASLASSYIYTQMSSNELKIAANKFRRT